MNEKNTIYSKLSEVVEKGFIKKTKEKTFLNPNYIFFF